MKNIILTAKRNYFKLKFKISDNDFIACGTRGDIKKTQWYIDNGVDIDAGYQDGTNLLHYLCVAQNREMIQLLLQNNAKVNLGDHSQRTPLFIIAQDSSEIRPDHLSGPTMNLDEKNRQRKEKSCLIAKDLIEYGADVNAKNNRGNTPLLDACYKENEKLVDLLLAHNADVFAKNKKGTDAFKCALNYKNMSIISSIVMAAKSIDELNKHLQTVNASKDPFFKNKKVQDTINTIRLKMAMDCDLTIKNESKIKVKKI